MCYLATFKLESFWLDASLFKALGNHEFDNGVEGLIQPFLQNVNCSVLSANMQPDQTLAVKLSGYYQPYTVLNVGSEKVAVVGYTTAEAPFLSMPGKPADSFIIPLEAAVPFISTVLTFQAPILSLTMRWKRSSYRWTNWKPLVIIRSLHWATPALTWTSRSPSEWEALMLWLEDTPTPSSILVFQINLPKSLAEACNKPLSPTQTNLCLQEKLRPLKCRQVLTLIWWGP